MTRWKAWLLCVALANLPLWWLEFPPSTDLPQHLSQALMLPAALAGHDGLAVQGLTPYWLGYLPLVVLTWVTPPAWLGRVALGLMAAALVSSAHWLAWRRQRSSLTAVLATPFIFSHVLYWGFWSFAFGWLAFVVWVELLSRAPNVFRWRAVCFAFLGFGLLYFSHALWFLAGLLWCAWDARVRRRTRAATGAQALGALPWVALAAWWYPQMLTRMDSKTIWWGGGAIERLTPQWWLDAALGGLCGPLEPVVLLCLAVCVVWGLVINKGERDQPLLQLAAMFFVLGLLLPTKHSNTVFLAQRWVPFGCICLVLALPLPPRVRFAPWLAVAIFVAVTLRAWRGFARDELGGLAGALSAVPPRSRVLGLTYLNESKWVKGRPFLQMFAYAQVLKSATLNFSFADMGPSPVVYLPPRERRDFEWEPDDASDQDLRAFDVVLVGGSSAAQETFAARPCVHPVTSLETWRLYRIDCEGE